VRGAFGGELILGDSDATETVPSSLAALLGTDRLRYVGSLADLSPLSIAGPGAAAHVLVAAQVALTALEALHASGHAHGDVRPAHIWTGARTVLTGPGVAVEPALLLRARIREGASLAETSFLAPELLAGGPASASADVYGLAASVYACLSGAPLAGTVRSVRRADVPDIASSALMQALDPDPRSRPSAAALRAALDTEPERRPVTRLAAPAPAASAAEVGERDTSIILTVLLILGGLFTVTGALWLVAVGWDAIGETGRFLILAGLTAGAGLGGAALERRGRAKSGFALLALCTLLLWADAALLLVKTRGSGHAGTSTAVVIAAATFWLARRRRSPLLGALVVLGAVMAASLTWQALDGSGRVAVLFLVTAALGMLGERLENVGSRSAGLLSLLAANGLVWVDGAYLLSQFDLLGTAGGWSAVALASALVGALLAVPRRSLVLGTIATLSTGAAVTCLGSAVGQGPASPATWALVTASVLAGLALAFGRFAGELAWPAAIGAFLSALASVVIGVSLATGQPGFALAWPYLVGAAVLVVSRTRRRALTVEALVVGAAGLLTIGVAGVIFVADDLPRAWTALAPLAGAALGTVALVAPGVTRARQVALCAVGLAHVLAAKSVALEALAFAATSFAFALRDGSSRLYLLAGLAASVSVCSEIGRQLGATVDMPALALLTCAFVQALIADVARRRSGNSASDGISVLVSISLGASCLLPLTLGRWLPPSAVLPDGWLLIWPYFVAALTGAFGATRGAGQARTIAFYTTTVLLVAAPIWQVTGYRGELPTIWVGGAPAAAGVLGALAFTWPRLANVRFRLVSCLSIALAHVVVARSPGIEVGAFGAVFAGAAARARSRDGLGAAAIVWAVALWLESQKVFGHASDSVALVALTCALAQVGIAEFARRRFGEEAAAAAGIFVALSLFVSEGGALARAEEGVPAVLPPGWTAVWPYVVALIAGAFGVTRGRGTLSRGLSIGLALLTFFVTPNAQAFAHEGQHRYLFLPSAVGAGLVLVALKWERVVDGQRLQTSLVLVGATNLVLAPGTLCFRALSHLNADALRFGFEGPIVLLANVVITAAALVSLGAAMGPGATRREPYRLLEVAGLLLFFVVLSLLSIERTDEYLYPAVLFPGAFVALCVGAWKRRLLLVAVPAGFLVPNLCLQYFAKLSGQFPFALLLIGFGLGMLVGGIFFELRVRPRLRELGSW
jgi:hypothetical protein